MKKKSFYFLIVIVAVVILSFFSVRYIMGASAISKLQVKVLSVQISEIKLSYTKLKLNLEILNPTGEDVSLLSAGYNIFIAGSIVGEGSMSLANIPAQTAKYTSTTVVIYFASVANAVVDAITNQNFNLTIQGTLHAKVFFGLFSISKDFSSDYYYF